MPDTPFELYCQYRSINVLLFNGTKIYNIDVHEYRNYNSTKNDFNCVSGWAAFEQLKAKIENHGLKSGNGYEISYPITGYPITFAPVINVEYVSIHDVKCVFIGKGSPANIQQALRLAVAFGLLEISQSAIQNYCDKNIGLDCSGFAGNYLGGNWRSTPCSEYAKKKINNLDDITTGTAIVWQNGKHVALVDKITGKEKSDGKTSEVKCMVAESTGDRMFTDGPSDGLNYSEYSISPASVGFNISRPIVEKTKKGLKQASHSADVYLTTIARESLSEPYIF
jgi:hypothetical protein